MTTRAQLVAEARSWVGVPIFHHGRSREGGVDCLGLILGVAEGTAYPYPIAIPDYGRLPNSHHLITAMDAHLLRLDWPRARTDAGDCGDVAATADELGDGDVIGLSWGKRDHPMHLAIAATFDGRRTIVHASPNDRRVLEVTFGGVWADRACMAWRFPHLTDV